MSTCPLCGAEQPEGLLCHDDTSRLEQTLAEIPWLVGELTVTISKQAKIGVQTGKGAPAHERNPINYGALTVSEELSNTLTTWARDVLPDRPWEKRKWTGDVHISIKAAHALLSFIGRIRRHPAVNELVDEITDASNRARQIIDRPADRQYVGPCMAETPDDEGRAVTCLADIWARLDAHETTCRTCGITHDVAERRNWMLREAEDRLFTVREAAQIIGTHGNITVSESTIRSYVRRQKLAYHGKVDGSSVIRLGDLLDVVNDHMMRKAAGKHHADKAA